MGASCNCDRTGYAGSRCETEVNECVATANPCGLANTCVDGVADYTCRCAPTYRQVSTKRCVPKSMSIVTRYQSCTTDAELQAICWGDDQTSPMPPHSIAGVSSVLGVALGISHVCAISARTANAVVLCWGRNTEGQLGNGAVVDSAVPVAVVGLSGVTSIAAGESHTCASTNDGRVWCWGTNTYGQLGTGGTQSATTPAVVSGIDNAKSVVAGTFHTCALKNDATVVCWGINAVGQLGNSREEPSLVPIVVAGLGSVAQLSAGFGHNCAVLTDGTIRCWGLNTDGEVGDGTSLNYAWTPRTVDGLTQVVEVSAGYEHTCARTRDYRLFCWGANKFGQFGDGTVDGSLRPFELTSAWPRLTAVSAGAHVTCGVNSDGNVMCSGFNFRGELGDSGAIPSRTPVQVLPPSDRTP